MPAARVMARVGIKRHAGHRHVDAEDLLRAALNRGHDPIRARLRRQRLGQQKLAHRDLDLRIAPGRSRDQLAQLGFDFGRVLFRDHTTVDAKDDLIRDHVGVDAALINPTFSVGATMPAVAERMRASMARWA